MNTQSYTVTGMTCSHCVNAVQEEVGDIDAVQQVDVDLESGAMVVTSSAPIPFEAITAAVAEAGDYVVTEA